eukprot:jgi/Botrbrau1/16379/Bobra.85_2s0004.1
MIAKLHSICNHMYVYACICCKRCFRESVTLEEIAVVLPVRLRGIKDYFMLHE